MQRFGNLKVGSDFGFFHPKTAVSVFKKRKNWKPKLRFRFLPSVWKRNPGVYAYYVVVGTDTLLQKKNEKKSEIQKSINLK